MRIRPQTVFSFLVLLFFAVVIWAARDWPVKAQLYPWVIGIPMLVLAAFHLVTDLRSRAGKSAFVVGILPGLGGLTTLALMLPFAYTIQEPIAAFCFLLGMHAITGTTGGITSRQ